MGDRAIYKCTVGGLRCLARAGSEDGEQCYQDQHDCMGSQAGGRVLQVLPTSGASLLLRAVGPPLKLQFWDDLVDPLVMGSDTDVDAWAVPAGTALAPADHPSLHPRLVHKAHQGASRVTLWGSRGPSEPTRGSTQPRGPQTSLLIAVMSQLACLRYTPSVVYVQNAEPRLTRLISGNGTTAYLSNWA